MSKTGKSIRIAPELIEDKVYLIRGEKVMLDRDLALLYRIEPKQLKRQVRRNISRFPSDFMFKLSAEENASLRCQTGTLKRGGHSKYSPYAFTENGVAMLSSVLNSQRAILVNIEIMRTFTRMRKLLASHQSVLQKLTKHELQLLELDKRTLKIFEILNKILHLPIVVKRKSKPIGFIPPKV